jgi:LysR family hydrogen peroxide-inducible transcriptional activator
MAGRREGGITLQKLRFLAAAVETEDFGAAADVCCVSQPSLSVGISSLENEFGQALFYRRWNQGCRVTATPFGREVAELARQTLALAQGIKDTAKRYHQQQRDSQTQ